MAEDVKVKIENKIVYGAIAGGVAGVGDVILGFLSSSIKLGKYDSIEYSSQQFFGTTPGNPNLVGLFILGILIYAVGGIILGIIIFLLLTRAGWERDLTRYLIVVIVFGVVLTLLAFITIIPNTEFDLLIDGPIQLIIGLINSLILALTFYYLEEQFGSAS